MYQPPEPAAYIPAATSFGIRHGLPEYTFQETPLGLGNRRAGSGGGGSVSGGSVSGGGGYGSGGHGFGNSGAVGTDNINSGTGAGAFYTAPIFSANTAALGPAPGILSSFPFHYNNEFHHNQNTTSPPLRIKMESNPDDIAAQEAAAREYQSRTMGPLVGHKTPSTAITEEYAKGDPVYVQKTTALPQTYSHYRPIQGDGNCGWRAIGFGYFETLISRGDKAQIESEKQRLQALNSYIETVGEMSPFVFLDMAEETIDLLDRISQALPDQDQAMSELMKAFNTQETSDSIIYHFRLLASSWLKGNREAYAAFVTSDRGIDGYCETTIQQHNREIEHLGLTLLVNVLLKPAGFVLEVAYLDRSPGVLVNTFRFPEEANGQDPSALGSMIHLLFRPDHYDILYPARTEIQVHRVDTTFQAGYVPNNVGLSGYSDSGLGVLSLIPGFGAPPEGLPPLVDAITGSPLTSYSSSSPGSTWMPSPFPETPRQQTQQTQQAPTAPVPVAAPVLVPQTHPLRFSEYCQLPEYVDNDTWREPTFQSSTFKNSHFNVAHYNNPNFQPEEYRPGCDESDVPTKGPGRKRGSVSKNERDRKIWQVMCWENDRPLVLYNSDPSV